MKHIKALAKRKWHLSKVIESLCVLSLPSWDQIDQQTSYPYSEQVPGTRVHTDGGIIAESVVEEVFISHCIATIPKERNSLWFFLLERILLPLSSYSAFFQHANQSCLLDVFWVFWGFLAAWKLLVKLEAQHNNNIAFHDSNSYSFYLPEFSISMSLLYFLALLLQTTSYLL
jgi:hypothetical protein